MSGISPLGRQGNEDHRGWATRQITEKGRTECRLPPGVADSQLLGLWEAAREAYDRTEDAWLQPRVQRHRCTQTHSHMPSTRGQASSGVAAGKLWLGRAWVALPAPATHSTAGWDSSGLVGRSRDHGGVDTASAPHSNPLFRVAPNTETLPKTGPKKSHPVSKEDRSGASWLCSRQASAPLTPDKQVLCRETSGTWACLKLLGVEQMLSTQPSPKQGKKTSGKKPRAGDAGPRLQHRSRVALRAVPRGPGSWSAVGAAPNSRAWHGANPVLGLRVQDPLTARRAPLVRQAYTLAGGCGDSQVHEISWQAGFR